MKMPKETITRRNRTRKPMVFPDNLFFAERLSEEPICFTSFYTVCYREAGIAETIPAEKFIQPAQRQTLPYQSSESQAPARSTKILDRQLRAKPVAARSSRLQVRHLDKLVLGVRKPVYEIGLIIRVVFSGEATYRYGNRTSLKVPPKSV